MKTIKKFTNKVKEAASLTIEGLIIEEDWIIESMEEGLLILIMKTLKLG
jgi:hypothetical protein